MPALNFKAQFAERVALGLKPHTIRARRKHPIKPGDLLYLYTGMRTKACRRLLVRPCWAATAIQITSRCRAVTLAEGAKFYPAGLLSAEWVHLLAVRDGFRNADEFFAFFVQPRNRSFFGHLIEWDFNAEVILAIAGEKIRAGAAVALSPSGSVINCAHA